MAGSRSGDWMSARHDPFLDIVRWVSAELVVIGHLMVLAFPNSFARALPENRLGAAQGQFHVQSYAVVVFLVLSGFLIARAVQSRIRRGTFELKGYLLDRASRLMTPLLPAMLLVVVGDLVFLGDSLYSRFVEVKLDPWTTVSNLVLLQDNIVLRGLDAVLGTEVATRSLGSAAPWWTVAYEWWIYVAFGTAISTVLLRRRGRAIAFWGAFAVATVVGVLLAGNGLALAWVVGAIYGWGWVALSRRRHALLCAASILAIVLVLVSRPTDVYAPWTAIATGVAVLSGHLATGPLVSRPWRVLSRPANFSYSLYLTHFSLLVWICASQPQLLGWGLMMAGLAASNAAAIVWWWAFERHYGAVRQQAGAWMGGSEKRHAKVRQEPA